MPLLQPSNIPDTVVPAQNQDPASDYLARMMSIPPARVFLIHQSLKLFQEANSGVPAFNASQGDCGLGVGWLIAHA
jgi:hypothetical protein